MLSPLTGRLRPKPNDIGQMDLISKEPAPEESGVVKFLHVGLLLLGQPEASSGKEQAAVRGRCSGRQAAVQGRGHDSGGYDIYWPDPQQPHHADIAFFRRS